VEWECVLGATLEGAESATGRLESSGPKVTALDPPVGASGASLARSEELVGEELIVQNKGRRETRGNSHVLTKAWRMEKEAAQVDAASSLVSLCYLSFNGCTTFGSTFTTFRLTFTTFRLTFTTFRLTFT
jgi:hypothetical protein